MLKKSMKIIAALLVVVVLALTLSQTVFAAPMQFDWDQAEQDLVNNTGDDGGAKTDIAKMANAIIGIVQVVGVAVAVIMLIVLAIKYISAAPSDKAEIKKHAVVYVVGAVVLFAATGILEIVKKFAGNIGS